MEAIAQVYARSLFEERFTRAVACRRYAEVFEMAAREGR